MEKKLSTAKKIIYGIVITATSVTAVAVPTAIKLTRDNHNNQQSTNNKDNFGSLPDSEPEIEAGTLVSDLIIPTPEKEGLEFKGWFKDPECTQPFADDEYVYSTTKVYAKWELSKYAISFNLPLGMSIQVLKVDGTEYTQEELSSIPHGTELNFRVISDDHINNINYLYTLTNIDDIYSKYHVEVIDNKYYLSYTFANCRNIESVYWDTENLQGNGPTKQFVDSGNHASFADTVFANSRIKNFEFGSRHSSDMLNTELEFSLVYPNTQSGYLSLGSIVKVENITFNQSFAPITAELAELVSFYNYICETITIQGTISWDKYNLACLGFSKYIYVNEADAETSNITLNDSTFDKYNKIESDRNGYAKYQYNR